MTLEEWGGFSVSGDFASADLRRDLRSATLLTALDISNQLPQFERIEPSHSFLV